MRNGETHRNWKLSVLIPSSFSLILWWLTKWLTWLWCWCDVLSVMLLIEREREREKIELWFCGFRGLHINPFQSTWNCMTKSKTFKLIISLNSAFFSLCVCDRESIFWWSSTLQFNPFRFWCFCCFFLFLDNEQRRRQFSTLLLSTHNNFL